VRVWRCISRRDRVLLHWAEVGRPCGRVCCSAGLLGRTATSDTRSGGPRLRPDAGRRVAGAGAPQSDGRANPGDQGDRDDRFDRLVHLTFSSVLVLNQSQARFVPNAPQDSREPAGESLPVWVDLTNPGRLAGRAMVSLRTEATGDLSYWTIGARKQDDLPGRPETIRRLVEIGLKAKK